MRMSGSGSSARVLTGYSSYSRGNYFKVAMTVSDGRNTVVFEKEASAANALAGWAAGTLPSETLEFDF